MITRHRLGLLLLVVGTIGALATTAVLITGWQWARTIPGVFDEALALTTDTLTQIQNDLDTADATLIEIDSGLAILTNATISANAALTDAAPIVEETRQLVTGEIPDALEAVEKAMPALIDVGAGVDTTLRIISSLGLATYEQEVPLNEAIAEISASLEGLPEELRAQDTTLRRAEMTLQELTADVGSTATGIVTIRQSLAEARPAINTHRETIDQAEATFAGIRATIHNRTVTLALVLAISGLSLILLESAAAVTGLALIRGQLH